MENTRFISTTFPFDSFLFARLFFVLPGLFFRDL